MEMCRGNGTKSGRLKTTKVPAAVLLFAGIVLVAERPDVLRGVGHLVPALIAIVIPAP
jgi:hypothetical protein